jgi:hypothetical protein
MTTGKMILCLGVLGSVLILPAMAAGPLSELMACRKLSDASARLACFDREAAALDAKPAALAAPVAPPQPVLDPKKQFGLPERTVITQEVAAGTRPSDAAKIEAHVVRLSSSADGRLILTLDNDQVWRQVVSSGEMLLKAGDAVTISRAMLGSYWLSAPTGRGCKVSRIH